MAETERSTKRRTRKRARTVQKIRREVRVCFRCGKCRLPVGSIRAEIHLKVKEDENEETDENDSLRFICFIHFCENHHFCPGLRGTLSTHSVHKHVSRRMKSINVRAFKYVHLMKLHFLLIRHSLCQTFKLLTLLIHWF